MQNEGTGERILEPNDIQDINKGNWQPEFSC